MSEHRPTKSYSNFDEIIIALTPGKIGNNQTYVGFQYSKEALIEDLRNLQKQQLDHINKLEGAIKTARERMMDSEKPFYEGMKLLNEALKNDKHDWENVDAGIYDSVYKCRKCGAEQIWSIDNSETELPEYGCT